MWIKYDQYNHILESFYIKIYVLVTNRPQANVVAFFTAISLRQHCTKVVRYSSDGLWLLVLTLVTATPQFIHPFFIKLRAYLCWILYQSGRDSLSKLRADLSTRVSSLFAKLRQHSLLLDMKKRLPGKFWLVWYS